jgi:uncharacterized protein
MTGTSTRPVEGPAPEVAAARGRSYEVEVVRDVRIPTGEPGVTLAADLFLPVGAGPVPALVTLLPYLKDGAAGIGGWYANHWFAARGYACLLVDFRGLGGSDGDQRPPFDAAEADDGVAAVEWAAGQPWCDGAVGMWGVSYGAITALRTAARRPAALRALVPVMGMLDPERDFVHPAGRGGLAALAQWSLVMLLSQLMPPLRRDADGRWRERWHRRVHHTEPWLVDLHRHGPGDPVWRDRVVRPESITAPTLCVGGWRDLFCDGTVRTYAQIRAPKALLMGPWMHTVPDESPFEPVDFLATVLRWWDRWLSSDAAESSELAGSDPSDAAVTVHVQGDRPVWLSLPEWPPPADTMRLGGTDLVPGRLSRADDPTVGALSGLWCLSTAGEGLPVDQHDDDMRSVCLTAGPLPAALTVVGTVSATVPFAPGPLPARLVVKLTDVDESGSSTMVTTGTATAASHGAAPWRVRLIPTAYRFAAGHRLRLVLASDDFPRLWPDPTAVLRPDLGDHPQDGGLRLELPVLPDGAGAEHPQPRPRRDSLPEPLALHSQPRWEVSRDLLNDAVTVTVGTTATAYTPQQEHLLATENELTATVARSAPAAARMHGVCTATVDGADGTVVRAGLEMTADGVTAVGSVSLDGVETVTRRWSV